MRAATTALNEYVRKLSITYIYLIPAYIHRMPFHWYRGNWKKKKREKNAVAAVRKSCVANDSKPERISFYTFLYIIFLLFFFFSHVFYCILLVFFRCCSGFALFKWVLIPSIVVSMFMPFKPYFMLLLHAATEDEIEERKKKIYVYKYARLCCSLWFSFTVEFNRAKYRKKKKNRVRFGYPTREVREVSVPLLR